MEDRAFALFFRPHPGGFDSSRVPTPGNLQSKTKKMLTPEGQPGGGGRAGRSWNWLMHYFIRLPASNLFMFKEKTTENDD